MGVLHGETGTFEPVPDYTEAQDHSLTLAGSLDVAFLSNLGEVVVREGLDVVPDICVAKPGLYSQYRKTPKLGSIR